MSNLDIILFPSSTTTTIAEVGGKGFSLIEGSKARLPVPPGFILSVAFFHPWFQQLQTTKAWSRFLQPDTYDLKKSCDTLKTDTEKLIFTKEQNHVLSEVLKHYDSHTLFAVRSSSPEEDLEGASFAGGYETVLGVSTKNIHQAIKKAFASCLDYRITVYKQENGFNIADPKIAVIVQQQIPSEIAGVGFSLNPVTNNFDEAVFTANFGLGETVVQGTATPDTYIVEKNSMKITDKHLGAKEISLWLSSHGGTQEKKEKRSTEFTLTDNQIRELTTLIKRVEKLYKKPIDIEWAYADEKLYLLQARPITGYVPLPSAMITRSEERKRLYLDMTISVQGITHPISITATSFFQHILKIVGHMVFNRDLIHDESTSPAIITGGRMYLNLSVFLSLLGRKRLLSFLHVFDPLTEKALSEIDSNQYIARSNKLSLLPWKLGIKFPSIAFRILKARQNPLKMHQQIQLELSQFVDEVKSISQQNTSISTLTNKLIQALINHAFIKTVPLFIATTSVRSELKALAGGEYKELFDQLDKALPNNKTTEMGLALFHVSQELPHNVSQEQLTKGIQTQSLPQPFLTAWGKFIDTYGFRGPEEIDIAAPRYHENPAMLFNILLTLKKSKDDTQAQFKTNQQKRKQAYEMIYQELQSQNPKKAHHFAKLYQFYETFAGYREAHKYYAALVIDLVRQRVLQEAKTLYESKRLDSVEQVFDLTLEQIDNALKNTSLDLRELIKLNRKFIDQLAKAPHLPTLIDSRGLIIKSHGQASNTGEVVGMAVSPGIARGKVKVLHNPTEKPFMKGEVLVARATDPGWTPLFVNASAVILEVGGMLQHGALVAREYGLPCVTGIENATNLWKDGTIVEVDGSEGIIRAITKDS